MKAKTPYEYLQEALIFVCARRLAIIDGPNPPKAPNGSELEFWHVPASDPARSRLVIIQRWTCKGSEGGFDVYLQSREHRTAHSIAEIIGRPIAEFMPHLPHEPVGHGHCRVCGKVGKDCTGDRRLERGLLEQVKQAKALGIDEDRRRG